MLTPTSKFKHDILFSQPPCHDRGLLIPAVPQGTRVHASICHLVCVLRVTSQFTQLQEIIPIFFDKLKWIYV